MENLNNIEKRHSHQRRVVQKLWDLYLAEEDQHKATTILKERDKETSKLLKIWQELIDHVQTHILSFPKHNHAKQNHANRIPQQINHRTDWIQDLFPPLSNTTDTRGHCPV